MTGMVGHSQVTYTAPEWDVRWRRSIAFAMSGLTEAMWQDRRRGWFAFGGCLFWVLLWYAVVAYLAVKVVIWAAAEVVLVLALLAVLAAGGVWRAWRAGAALGRAHGSRP